MITVYGHDYCIWTYRGEGGELIEAGYLSHSVVVTHLSSQCVDDLVALAHVHLGGE